jgi:hypothetical protein
MQLLPFVCKLCHLWIDCLLYSSWLAPKIAMCIYLPFVAGLRFKRNGYALVMYNIPVGHCTKAFINPSNRCMDGWVNGQGAWQAGAQETLLIKRC